MAAWFDSAFPTPFRGQRSERRDSLARSASPSSDNLATSPAPEPRDALREASTPAAATAEGHLGPELWVDPHICYPDRGRLPFKSVCWSLRPDVRSSAITSAVAAGARLCGMRVAEQEDAYATVIAERLEAPFLSSISKDAGSGGPQALDGEDNPDEWRMLVATLGVGETCGRWGGLDRVLQLRFLTGPVSEKAQRRARTAATAAALSSELAGMVSRAAAAYSALGFRETATAVSDTVPPRPAASAAAFARALSEQRAESLLQAVLGELQAVGATLSHLEGWEDPWPTFGDGEPKNAEDYLLENESDSLDERRSNGRDNRNTEGARSPGAVVKRESWGADLLPGSASNAADADEEEEVPLPSEIDLSEPLNASESGLNGASGSVGAPSVSPHPLGADDLFVLVPWSSSSSTSTRPALPTENGTSRSNVLTAAAASSAGGSSGASSGVGATEAVIDEVLLDLQFVESACARSRGLSLIDARETWRPLERAMSELEAENSALRKLLEPKYRQLGLELPPQPKYAGDGSGGSGGSGGSVGSGNDVGEAGSAALKASPLFRFRDGCVTARVGRRRRGGPADRWPAAGGSNHSGRRRRQSSSGSSYHENGGARGLAGKEALGKVSAGILVRAAVALLANVIEAEFELAAEALVKGRIRGAQRYVAALESHRRALVATVALARPPKDDSEELQRVFGTCTETLLHSCQAALGRRPGRLYLTHTSLWFHSKVLGMESKYILPLSTVMSVAVLSSPLRLSASLALKTAYLEEVMFVFPGQSPTSLEPLACLVRRLLALPQEKGQGW